MQKFLVLCCVSAVWSIPVDRNIDSKSIARSNEFGNVNLVEVNVGGVNYGQCSYKNQGGEEITLIFEEAGDDLKAKSSLPHIADPVAEARSCRSAAVSSPRSRSTMDDAKSPETDFALWNRISDLQNKLALNQQYVSQLSPRLINFVPLPANTVQTGNIIRDKFANLFNGVNFGSVNVPFPVINVPFGFQNIPVPIVVPQIQTINIPKPVIGK